MFENTKWTRRVLGATTGVTLVLGLAVVGGADPSQDHPSGLRSASAAPRDAAASSMHGSQEQRAAEEAADAVAVASADLSPEAQAEQAARTDDAGASDAPGQAPAEEKPDAPPPPPPTAAVAPPAPQPAAPPPAPPAHSPVPRRQPSPAEVQQALDGLKRYVDSVFAPSPAQVAEAGDKVCTAFDQGQSFTQVKATARELVAKVPLTTVHAGADDYVVRTVVALYCPGHAPKLV
ncbi:MAG TPA: DUF732 domain-containing protein [Egibacteraceae bacterium]|nr:DUF732 domain-containing protein [Egibacteraceae bacterium]